MVSPPSFAVPIAQAFADDEASIAVRPLAVFPGAGTDCTFQAVPFHRISRGTWCPAFAPEPTAQAFVEEVAVTPASSELLMFGLGCSCHEVPFQCWTYVKYFPAC